MTSFFSQGSCNFEDNMDRFPKATNEDLRFCGVCSFCLEEITSGSKLGCGHVVHEKCLNWLQLGISCPMCKDSFIFPLSLHHRQWFTFNVGDECVCYFCLEEIISEKKLKCPRGHVFHVKCLNWLQLGISCPMCRDTKKQSKTKTHVIAKKVFFNSSSHENGLSEPEGGEQEQNGDSASDIIDLYLTETGFSNFQQEVDQLLNEEKSLSSVCKYDGNDNKNKGGDKDDDTDEDKDDNL